MVEEKCNECQHTNISKLTHVKYEVGTNNILTFSLHNVTQQFQSFIFITISEVVHWCYKTVNTCLNCVKKKEFPIFHWRQSYYHKKQHKISHKFITPNKAYASKHTHGEGYSTLYNSPLESWRWFYIIIIQESLNQTQRRLILRENLSSENYWFCVRLLQN